jgi:hypothetical protein
VGPRAVLDAVVKRKIASPRRKSNPRTPIIQPVAQPYPTELSRLYTVVREEEICLKAKFFTPTVIIM